MTCATAKFKESLGTRLYIFAYISAYSFIALVLDNLTTPLSNIPRPSSLVCTWLLEPTKTSSSFNCLIIDSTNSCCLGLNSLIKATD